MPEYVYDAGNWKYVEICGRVKDLGCSEWFPSICERLIYECISRSRTMEVAVVICCAYEWDWNYMRWMAVDVDLDHKNDDSHVIGCWSIVVWRAMMYTGGDRDWTAPWGELESFLLRILWRGLANQNGCCYVSTNEILRSDYWSIAVDDDVTARYG